MAERVSVRQGIDEVQRAVVWPDPSPLGSWWEAVMRESAPSSPGSGRTS
ncbi:hypothetical protein [Nocardia sp. BMG51109]|nr:hypothetical protein [Nocardia sp. BMG51109]